MASIKEIANACGVSPTTVSRILSHDPSLSVSSAVRGKVEAEAQRMDYRTPRQKRSERTFNISSRDRAALLEFLWFFLCKERTRNQEFY